MRFPLSYPNLAKRLSISFRILIKLSSKQPIEDFIGWHNLEIRRLDQKLIEGFRNSGHFDFK